MKVIKILIAVLVTGVMVAALFGCSSKTNNTASSTQVATVKRGDLSLTITAAGNLALSKTQDLAVDLFYPSGTKGTIGSVLVDTGDSVKAGQVLVTLDKDEWNNQLANLQNLVTTAERTLTQAQSNLLSAQQTLANLQDTSAKEKSILSAEIGLQQAESNLTAGVASVDLNALEGVLNKAKTWYEFVNTYLKQTMVDRVAWQLTLEDAKLQLDAAQTNYDNSLAGYDSRDVNLKKKQLEITRMTLEAARKDLANVPQSIALQKIQVALTEGKVADAQKALDDAKKNLADAQGKSPEVKATFDGFVTQVNVSGGDEVLKGTVAVTVADPTMFEADVLVSEMDIMKVSLGGDATITLNALTGVSLPAKITQIAPTATISSGVVNYAVKVELDAQAVSRIQQANQAALTANTTGQPGVPSGNFTNRAGAPSGAGTQFSGSSGSRASSQLPSTVTQNFQLKQGLTGTVNLIVAQKSNVLLVLTTAITTAGNQKSVQVVTGNSTTEKRSVQTGLSDWQNTEITSGLSEGDKIIVPKNTAPTSTATTSQQRPPGGIQFLGR